MKESKTIEETTALKLKINKICWSDTLTRSQKSRKIYRITETALNKQKQELIEEIKKSKMPSDTFGQRLYNTALKDIISLIKKQ